MQRRAVAMGTPRKVKGISLQSCGLALALAASLLSVCCTRTSTNTNSNGNAAQGNTSAPPAPTTGATKDLVDEWNGWGGVEIKSKEGAYEGTYKDTFGTGPGTFKFRKTGDLTYDGTWGESEKRHGTFTLTVSQDGNSIKVNWKADANSKIRPGDKGDDTW